MRTLEATAKTPFGFESNVGFVNYSNLIKNIFWQTFLPVVRFRRGRLHRVRNLVASLNPNSGSNLTWGSLIIRLSVSLFFKLFNPSLDFDGNAFIASVLHTSQAFCDKAVITQSATFILSSCHLINQVGSENPVQKTCAAPMLQASEFRPLMENVKIVRIDTLAANQAIAR